MQAFLNWDKDNLLAYYDRLKTVKYNPQKIHPILLGRCFAAEIYFSAITQRNLTPQFTDPIINEINRLHQKRQNYLTNQLVVNFIFQALQLTQSFDIIDLLYEKLKILIDKKHDYWTDNIVNFFQIIDIHRQVKKTALEGLNERIEQINKNKFVQFEKNIQSFGLYFMLRDYYLLVDNNKAHEYDILLKDRSSDCGYTFALEMRVINS